MALLLGLLLSVPEISGKISKYYFSDKVTNLALLSGGI